MVPRRIVVMGVSGSGKSTVAQALARGMGARFLEADSFHPAANIDKMASGIPLTDDDRWPWLAALRREMRDTHQVVVACSALKRSYRDALRRAGEVRFVYLVVDRAEILRRVGLRRGHFMGLGMVESQLTTLEPPDDDETDVASVDADGDISSVLAAAEATLDGLGAGTATAPLRRVGGERQSISADELAGLVAEIASTEVVAAGARRVLLVPPDHTRLQSRAGEITGLLFVALRDAGCDVAVLPALGTHAAMTPDQVTDLFGGRVAPEGVLQHRWRDGLVRLGEISAAEVSAVSGGRMGDAIPVEVDKLLLEGWDLVVSVGQVVPHEVIGMANYTKNLVIGLGGAATINRSHFLGAVCDMERVMGRADSPVRDIVDAAFDRFVDVKVLWILTVMQDTPDGVVQRGLFVGRGRSNESGGAAYRAAAQLGARCNITVVEHALPRVACWLDPAEFTTTWLGNKAVYRTRMAIADGGELIVLGPGVSRFGEDAVIDGLIRRHGYRGTAATLDALRHDPELADNLGAAAHLIHGSSEGRFRIVYCTDPAAGGLRRDEVEGVGFEWRCLSDEIENLGINMPMQSGRRVDQDGVAFEFIANPALGLWAAPTRFP